MLECVWQLDELELLCLIQACKGACCDELTMRAELMEGIRKEALAPDEEYNERTEIDGDGNPRERVPWRDLPIEEMPQTNEPLMEAIKAGRDDEVKCFLEAGVSVDSYGLNAIPILHLALQEGHFGIAEMLLKRGANPNIESQRVDRALDSLIGVF